MTQTLQIVALAVTGFMVGTELCVAAFLNQIFARLPENSGLAGRSDGARVLGKVMPFWYCASIALSACCMTARWGEPGAVAAGIATALFGVSIVMTVALLVPINNRAKSWTPQNAPADWREQLRRWDRLHFVRVGVIGAGFVLLAVSSVS